MLASTHLTTVEFEDGSMVLVNSLSGAVDVVDAQTRPAVQKLLNNEPVAGQEALANALERRGHLFSSPTGERTVAERLSKTADEVFGQQATNVVICPTLVCNFRCVYCFESEQSRSQSRTMTSEMVDTIFDVALPDIVERSGCQAPEISLFGGEPLLPVTRGVVERCLQRAGELGLPLSATTNGSHIVRFHDLWQRYPGTMVSMQVTLDGPGRFHDIRRPYRGGRGSFAAVVDGIQCALDDGIRIALRVNLDAQNLSGLPELAQFIKARSWHENPLFMSDVAPVTDHLCSGSIPNYLEEDELVRRLLPMLDADPSLREVFGFKTFRVLNHLIAVVEGRKEFESFAAFHYCEANRGGFFTFCPDGLVYPCPESVGDHRVAIGTFFPQYRLEEAALSGWRSRTTDTIPKCSTCSVAGFCGGGCAYAALQVHGTTQEPVCGRAPEIVRSYIELRKPQFTGSPST